MHEFFGVASGRVSLAHVAGVSDDLKEVVMSPAQDEFYAQVRNKEGKVWVPRTA